MFAPGTASLVLPLGQDALVKEILNLKVLFLLK